MLRREAWLLADRQRMLTLKRYRGDLRGDAKETWLHPSNAGAGRECSHR